MLGLSESLLFKLISGGKCKYIITFPKMNSIYHISSAIYERHGVSNLRQFDCLFNNLFGPWNKEGHKAPHYVRGIHRWRVELPHKGPVMWKTLPCHDYTMHTWSLNGRRYFNSVACYYHFLVWVWFFHYSDVIMGMMVSQITSLTMVYSSVYSGADQRKHQTPRHWPLCHRWIPVTGEFPAQKANNTENVLIWWRHHVGATPWNKRMNMYHSVKSYQTLGSFWKI